MLTREGVREGLRLPSTDVRREEAKPGVTGAARRRRVC